MYEYTGSGIIQIKGSAFIEVQIFKELPVYSTFSPFISDKHIYPERFWDWITRFRTIIKPTFLLFQSHLFFFNSNNKGVYSMNKNSSQGGYKWEY